MIFGKELYLSLAFNLRDPVGSVRVGGDKSVNWYKDKMNQANPTDTSENYYDNPNQFVDFELSGKMYNRETLADKTEYDINRK